MAETKKKTCGRKKAFNSPAELQAAINQYFADCESQGLFPDYAVMRLAIGLGETAIANYQREDHEFCDEYKRIFTEARDRRESYLVRKMVTDNKLAQGCMNALKQVCNGGYVDKPVDQTEHKLIIECKGNITAEDFK